MTKRRRAASLLAAGATLLVAACATPGSDPAAISMQSAALADRFQAELQGQLMAAMQAGGPEGAIAVCLQAAPAIAESLSAESGAQVRRIALKERNPAARTEGALRTRLEQLAANPLSPDGSPATMTWTEGTGRKARVHWLRAIPMKAQPCAACHGTSIAPAVQARLAELYPDDKATGFRPGDLRGAIAITWPAGKASRID
ncbi:MAG: DUF3365 domain-containing protein [Novosphingobium sp.]